MITIATLAYLAALSDFPIEALSTPHGRAHAMFEVARRRSGAKWYAKDALVTLLWRGADDYCVLRDGEQIAKGPLGKTLQWVKWFVVGLDVPLRPTPTARAYKQFGCWVDVLDGYLASYVMFVDGGWDEDPAGVEFACQHMIDHVNVDFGTSFTMDDFQEGDACTCVE